MRQIVLDTETTGLAVEKGHRVIEIGCIELCERRPSGRTFHRFLNPERDIEQGALEVHGLSNERLKDEALFATIAHEFIDFIRGAELVIHNAAFDVAFLDAELQRAGPEYGRVRDHAAVLDTLAMAREKYPGQRNGLDALCKRLNVDNSHRQLHGALLDAQLLADVYLAMTAGQGDLGFGVESAPQRAAQASLRAARQRVPVKVVMADSDELAAHAERLKVLQNASQGRCMWIKLTEQAD